MSLVLPCTREIDLELAHSAPQHAGVGLGALGGIAAREDVFLELGVRQLGGPDERPEPVDLGLQGCQLVISG